VSHVQLLEEIERRGLRITAAGSDLRLQGPRDRIDPELVGRIKEAKADLLAHLAEPDDQEGFPLTPLQRSYLLGRGDGFEMGNIASHIFHEIEGAWDLDRLEAALRAVAARHGMLRTRFTPDGRQIEEAAPAGLRISRLDLRGEPAEQQGRRQARLREERSHRVLDAGEAPLLAVDATILADDRMVLHVGHDGLIMDGISMFLFFRAWWDHYRGGPETAEHAPEEASFEAYVEALGKARQRPATQRSRDYWLARLDDLPPHPDLPLRTSPAAITRPRFTQREIRLDAGSWAVLKERAAKANITPTCVLLAAYAETLAAWGAGSHFTLNSTVAERPPVHPRILDAIGNFCGTMLVEIEIDRSARFADRARALQARMRRDLDHRHFSGIEVMRELGRRRGSVSEARMPFTFNSTVGYPLEGVDASALELFGPEVFTISQTPQVWLNVFAQEEHGGVAVQMDGVEELFPEGLLEAIAAGYRSMLAGLLDEEAWTARTFDLMPEEQKARRRAANDTAAPIPDGLLHEAFVAWAEKTPEAAAVVTAGAVLSYGELHEQARQAAAWLRARQVGRGRGELVGLVMKRGPEQIVGILATLMAGAAYLPVDATLPAERIAYMLRDGNVRCVLTNADWSDPGGSIEALALDATQHPAETGAPAPAGGTSPDDLAYVLYTSGTTGEPKGVMVSHRSVANVVADCNTRFKVGPQDRFFGISAFNFDLSVYDVFGALSAGAAIVLPDHDRAADPAHWLELCAGAGVTVWNSVPAIVALLRDQAAGGEGLPASLRLVMMSGDRIPPALPAAVRALKPDAELVSLGGPTETTIWNILHPIGAAEGGGEASIPYGRPNANNRAYVLDAEGNDLPDWVAGEIHAAGAGLARGYWGDEARTAERFFYDVRRGERLYRTGDIGHYLPDGTIAIVGRGDHQMKINGYRIEAGEVETRLAALHGVRQAAVVREEGARGDRLVAHLVPLNGDRPGDAEIRRDLREHLPHYMIPAVLVWHESLPLTRNGKVDRRRLMNGAHAPAEAGPVTGADDPADAETERALAEIWRSVLRADRVVADDDLYTLGGDSISAARILTDVRRRFGVAIPLDQLPEIETVRAMAARIRTLQDGKAGDA